MRDHTKLRAFELADRLALLVYEHTRHLPREEQFGLTSQMRRAGVSIACNMVEGCARESLADSGRPETGGLRPEAGGIAHMNTLLPTVSRLCAWRMGLPGNWSTKSRWHGVWDTYPNNRIKCWQMR